MREIKFRAWSNGKMEPVFYLTDYHMICHTLSMDAEFMQYTGLKDKNGKEIYEGDVVYLAGYGDCLVEFPFMQLYQSSFENDIGEVIGNIYAGPELVEVEG